jgi:hypothetical protein
MTSLLPQRILPPHHPITDPRTGIITRDWWLLLYNLSQQLVGGSVLTPEAAYELASADGREADTAVLDAKISALAGLLHDPAVQPLQDFLSNLLLTEVADATPVAQPTAAITVGGSPFSYTAPFAGTVVVQGGTVSAIALVRQGTSTTTGLTVGVFPVSRGDVVAVTYTGTPTMSFLPR